MQSTCYYKIVVHFTLQIRHNNTKAVETPKPDQHRRPDAKEKVNATVMENLESIAREYPFQPPHISMERMSRLLQQYMRDMRHIALEQRQQRQQQRRAIFQ